MKFLFIPRKRERGADTNSTSHQKGKHYDWHWRSRFFGLHRTQYSNQLQNTFNKVQLPFTLLQRWNHYTRDTYLFCRRSVRTIVVATVVLHHDFPVLVIHPRRRQQAAAAPILRQLVPAKNTIVSSERAPMCLPVSAHSNKCTLSLPTRTRISLLSVLSTFKKMVILFFLSITQSESSSYCNWPQAPYNCELSGIS